MDSVYRYMATDVVTGRVLADNIPLNVYSMSRAINQIGNLTGYLNLLASPNQALVRAWREALERRRCMLYAFQDGFPVWCGIVTSGPHQSVLDNTLPISASTPEWLLQSRVISDPISWRMNQDPLAVFRALVTYAVSKTPNGAIAGLQMRAQNSGLLINIAYDASSLQKVYDALTSLATTYGFEFTFRPALSDAGTPLIYADHAYPKLGSVTSQAFELPGNLLDYAYAADSSSFANRIYGTTSAGGIILASVQSASSDLNAGYPLMEDSVSWSTTGFQSDLDAFVAGELQSRAANEIQPALVLGAGQYPRARDINLGDTVTFLGTNTLHPAYADNSPGLQARGRIVGLTLFPPGPEQVEQTQIQLAEITITGTGPSQLPLTAPAVVLAPATAPSSTVTIFGAAGTFAGVSSWVNTKTGQTFSTVAVPGWKFGAGEGFFYTCALPGGQIAMSTVPLTGNELKPTSDHAEMNFFDPAARRFYSIIIPTSAGATVAVSPGKAFGGTDAGAGDMVLSPSNGRLIFTCSGYYFNWSIPSYGLYPGTGAMLQNGKGDWEYRSANSKTGDQIHDSNASVFTSVINASQTAGTGGSYWALRALSQLAVFPKSQNIVAGHYFGGNGFNGGCISVFDPNLNLLCSYQVPNMNRQDGATPVAPSPREIKTDPSSLVNDERFAVIYDVFGVAGNGQPVPNHVIQEFSYNASTQTITPKSVPCIGGVTDTQPGPCWFDTDGTLYVPGAGQNTGGLNAFNPRNMDVYLKKSGERNLVTAAPATGAWATNGSYATPVAPDYSLGFAVAQGIGTFQPVVMANGVWLGPTVGGKLGVLIKSGSGFGANQLTGDNSTFESSVGVWTGFVTNLASSTAFAHGGTHSMRMFSGFSQTQFNANSGIFTVTPYQEYYASAWFTKDVASPNGTCRVGFNWYSDLAATTQIGTTTTAVMTVISSVSGTWVQAWTGNMAPAGAVTCKVHLQVDGAVTVTAGNSYYADDVFFGTQPYISKPAPDLGVSTLGSTYNVSMARPCIVSGTLYIPVLNSFSPTESLAYDSSYIPDSNHPQFLVGVKINDLLS